MADQHMQTFLKFLMIPFFMLLLTHCASYEYTKREVQQGNLLPEKKIKQLKRGMTKEEVAVLMGTSLLSPMFNNNRWDYVYTWRKGSGSDAIQHVIIYFANDRVIQIES